MTWPLAIDYDAAVQTPRASFSDPELASGAAATNMLGLPLTYAGGFANVYKFECGKNTWAVKCFTREVTDHQDRYAAISEHLRKAGRKFAVEFLYLAEGIRIKGDWYPILKMRWVEGFTLNEFLRDHAGNASLLEQMSALWLRLGGELRESKMAHADLQHGNVMLVPGGKEKAVGLRLIDYDGMWVPPLAGRPPGEIGHPNYQHPSRSRESYSAEIDRFSHLVMFTAFRCLVGGGMALWNRYDNAENLLFKEADFRDPAKSKLWPELLTLPDAHTAALVGHLLAASQRPLEQVPLVHEIYSDGRVAPLAPELRELVREKVPSVRPAKPAAPPPPVPAPEWLPTPALPIPAPVARKARPVLTPIPAPPETIPVVSIPPVPLDALPVEEEEPVEVVAVLALPPIPFAPERQPADVEVARAVRVPALPDAATLAEQALARATQVIEIPEPRGRQRPENPDPEKKGPFPVPDWLLGLGLPPDSAVVRFWPLVLGGLAALPLVLLLAVWLLWPAGKRDPEIAPPDVRRPTLRGMDPVELRAGHEVAVEVRIDDPDGDHVLQLDGLPPGVEGKVVPGKDAAKATVRLTARPDAAGGEYMVSVRLMLDGEAADEKPLAVRTRAFVKPELREWSNIQLTQGKSTDVLVTVKRNGNTDPLSLSLDPMPAGVRAEALLSPGPDHVGMRLTADADAATVEGALVKLRLSADGLAADKQNVSLSLRATGEQAPKGEPAVRLAVPDRLALEAGGSARLAVRLERVDYKGAVKITAEKLPLGVTARSVTVPEGQDTAEMAIEAKRDQRAGYSFGQIDIVAWAGERRLARVQTKVAVRGPTVAEQPKEKKDEAVTADLLRGTWKVVRCDTFGADGRPTGKPDPAAPSQVSFIGNQWLSFVTTNGILRQGSTCEWTLDTGKDPPTITLQAAQRKGKVVTMRGVVRVRDRQVEILYTLPPKAGPTRFDKPPTGSHLLILSRN